MRQKLTTGEIRFTEDGRGIRRRTYLTDHKGLPPSTLWTNLDETGHNRQAKAELKRLFPDKPTSQLFATPKPEKLMWKILRVGSDPNDIILDCFLGSGTTAAVAHKMGRRWIGVEWSAETLETYAVPRLTAVVAGDDQGGITETTEWKGGGGFRVVDVSPSMFGEDGRVIVLSEWATNGALAEATAAQLHFDYEADAPFAGRRGRTRLAVIDGLVSEDVVRILVESLPPDEKVVICGTAVDPTARDVVRELRRGSTIRKIPQSILHEYRQATTWTPKSLEAPEPVEVGAS